MRAAEHGGRTARFVARSGIGELTVISRELFLNLLARPRGLRRALRRIRPRRPVFDAKRAAKRVVETWKTREALFGADFFAGKRILEIGSGSTFGVALCALASGAELVGNVEMNEERIVYERPLYETVLATLRSLGYPHVERARAALRWTAERVEPDGRSLLTRYGENARRLAFESASFDFVFSVAVLEHVRGEDLPGALAEIHRVLRAGGTTSHRVDTCDHYHRYDSNPLVFLRYPSWLYERMYSNRDSFSNRYRLSDFVRLFRDAGFRNPRLRDVTRFDHLLAWSSFRPHLAPEFSGYEDEDLRVTSFLIDAER